MPEPLTRYCQNWGRNFGNSMSIYLLNCTFVLCIPQHRQSQTVKHN